MKQTLYAETIILNVKYTISLGDITVVTIDGITVPPRINGGMKEVLRFIARHLKIKLVTTHTRRIARRIIRELNARRGS